MTGPVILRPPSGQAKTRNEIKIEFDLAADGSIVGNVDMVLSEPVPAFQLANLLLSLVASTLANLERVIGPGLTIDTPLVSPSFNKGKKGKKV